MDCCEPCSASAGCQRGNHWFLNEGEDRQQRRARTASPTNAAASAGSSCSQTLITIQPAMDNNRVFSTSLRRVDSILSRHQCALALGQLA